MALIECGECRRQVSNKAPACPGCGAPIAASVPATAAPATSRPALPEPKKRMRTTTSLLIALLCGAAYFAYRVNSGPAGSSRVAGMPEAFRQPRKLVSERVGLKEGQAMMYAFTLASAARVEVTVSARPKNVDVMLMTAADLESYKRAMGKLFGGHYSYRKTLSRQGVQAMTESETLPAGDWAIVVQRPQEDVLFTHDTSVSIQVTAF